MVATATATIAVPIILQMPTIVAEPLITKAARTFAPLAILTAVKELQKSVLVEGKDHLERNSRPGFSSAFS
jgi:hypothetical protein